MKSGKLTQITSLNSRNNLAPRMVVSSTCWPDGHVPGKKAHHPAQVTHYSEMFNQVVRLDDPLPWGFGNKDAPLSPLA